MPDDMNDFFDNHEPAQDDVSTHDPDDTLLTGPPRPPRSRREMRELHEKRRRDRILAVIAIIVVVALVAVGFWIGYQRLVAWKNGRSGSSQSQDYPGPGDGQVEFTVKGGEGPTDIAKNLEDMGIIRSAPVFNSVVAANESTLYPGIFTLKYHMAADDVRKILSDPSKAGGFLEVRAGETVKEVIATAVKVSGIDQGSFDALVSSGGPGILPAEAGGSFEGWLEPGTYDIQGKKSAAEILSLLVQKRQARLDEQGVPTGADRERILNIASIVEEEVNAAQYYGKVVRVILNRISQNMNLGMDSTVAYGAGVPAGKLTDAILADSSNPYNTRVHAGLPPTPIGNPGDTAITAALNPEHGDWLYFVTTNLKTGETKFATTEQEFWKLREEYKNSNENAN